MKWKLKQKIHPHRVTRFYRDLLDEQNIPGEEQSEDDRPDTENSVIRQPDTGPDLKKTRPSKRRCNKKNGKIGKF